MMNRICTLLILLIAIAICPATEVQANSAAYKKVRGLWSGKLTCKYRNASEATTNWRIDLVINSAVTLENGKSVRPAVFANVYLLKGGKYNFHSRSIFDAVVENQIVTLVKVKGRLRNTTGVLQQRSKNVLIAKLPVCGRKLKTFSLKRFALPKQHKQIMGLWQGNMEGCGFSNSPVSMYARFMPFNGREIILDTGYDAQPVNQERLEGRNMFIGSYDKAKRAYVFKFAVNSKKNEWAGRDRIGTTWRPDFAKFDFEDPTSPGNKIFAEIGSCPFGEFKRAAKRAKATAKTDQQASQNQNRVTTKSLVGEWEGQATCTGRNRISQFSLFVEKISGDRINGYAYYYDPDIINRGMTWGWVVGRRSTQRKSYQFIIDGRANGVPRTLHKFTVLQGKSGKDIQVNFNDGSCQAVQLRKVTKNDPSRKIVIRAKSPKGLFYSKRRPLDRCQVLVDWMNQMRHEYPKINWHRTAANKIQHKYVALFSDESFIPVYGKAFDETSAKERAAPFKYINRYCRNDALMKEDLKDFDLFRGPMFFDTTYTTGFSYYAVKHAVREIRKIKFLARANGTAPLKTQEAVVTRIGQLSAAKKALNAEKSLLWPSDQRKLMSGLDKRINRLSTALVKSIVQEASAVPDPVERLKQAKLVGPSAEGKYKNLQPGVRKLVASRSMDIQRSALTEIQQQSNEQLVALPASLVGLRQLEKLSKLHDTFQIMLLPGVQDPMRAVLEKKRGEIVQSLVVETMAQFDLENVTFENIETLKVTAKELDSVFTGYTHLSVIKSAKLKYEARYIELVKAELQNRISSLDNITSGAGALNSISQWKVNVVETFKPLNVPEVLKSAMSKYSKKRNSLIKQSLPTYESQVNGLPVSRRLDLLEKYLPDPADRKAPVALQFLLIAHGN